MTLRKQKEAAEDSDIQVFNQDNLQIKLVLHISICDSFLSCLQINY